MRIPGVLATLAVVMMAAAGCGDDDSAGAPDEPPEPPPEGRICLPEKQEFPREDEARFVCWPDAECIRREEHRCGPPFFECMVGGNQNRTIKCVQEIGLCALPCRSNGECKSGYCSVRPEDGITGHCLAADDFLDPMCVVEASTTEEVETCYRNGQFERSPCLEFYPYGSPILVFGPHPR